MRPTPRLRKQARTSTSAAGFFTSALPSLIEVNAARWLVMGEIVLIHAREGIIDPATKRISEATYKPVGRLFADRWCTTRERFDLPGDLPK